MTNKTLEQLQQELDYLNKQREELAAIIQEEQLKSQKEEQYKRLVEGPGYIVSYHVFSKLVNFVDVMRNEGYADAKELFELLMRIGENEKLRSQQNVEDTFIPEDSETEKQELNRAQEEYKEYINSLNSWLGTITQNAPSKSIPSQNIPSKNNIYKNTANQNTELSKDELEDISEFFKKVLGLDFKCK